VPKAKPKAKPKPKSSSSSVVDQVCRKLLKQILSGRYGDNARLPAERELAVELNASRVCVREALRKLMGWQVVVTRPGSGATVMPRRQWTLGVLPYAFTHGVVIEDWEGLYRLSMDALSWRRFLILELVRRAGPEIPPRRLHLARDVIKEAWDRRHDMAAFVAKDLEVVSIVLETARLYPSLWMYNGLYEPYRAVLVQVVQQIPIPDLYIPTQMAMVDALEAGDGATAAAEMEHYLNAFDRALMPFVPSELMAIFNARRAESRNPLR
jgi:DNA-binding FadR family transcriptional regulator